MSEDPVFETEAVFDPETYLYFYADRVSDERSTEEAEFIEEALSLSAGDRVLDVPCGHGRIANRLADRGYDVAGLDRTAGFLDRARADARDRGVDPEYVRGDMRSLPWPDDEFDAAYNLFTSFGYFDEAGNRRVLDEVARVLRPGAPFLVDVVDRDAVLTDFDDCSVLERDGDYLIDRSEYDPRTGRITTERTTVVDGDVEEATYSVRAYPYTELESRLEDAGFAVVDDYGGTDGADYTLETSRLVLVGRLER